MKRTKSRLIPYSRGENREKISDSVRKYGRIAGRLLLVSMFVVSAGCSINKLATDALTDMLGGQGGGADVFLSDEDPELIGDALPLALKLFEALLASTPENVDLLQTTGSGFISYANAFIQTPASMLPEEQYKEKNRQNARAKKMYLRGRDYVLQAIEVKYPGFLELMEEQRFEEALAPMQPEDTGLLYWAGAGWAAAIAVDVFDTNLTVTSSSAIALMAKALELDETYGAGSIHDFFIAIYASIPENMMFRSPMKFPDDAMRRLFEEYYDRMGVDAQTGMDKAKFHFERAVELAGDIKAGPYVSYATSIAIKEGDHEAFIRYLETALAVDVGKSPENRMVNVLAQQKARWLLDHIDDFFLF